jgi:glycosyltransferase involved in cell wall biosynthesis
MIRVVHLTTVHRLWDVRIFHKQAVSLARAGFDVTLIACAEKAEVRDGVRLMPLPPPRSRWHRMTVTAWRAYRAALKERAAVYHFHDPELIPVGLLLKLHGRVVFYDVHEDVVKDIVDKAYIPAWARRPVQAVARFVEAIGTRCFDQMVAATSSIARNFPARKTTLVRNVPIPGELAQPASRPFAERPRRVVYIGGLAPFNGAAEMVAAMAELPPASGIRLTLAGRFSSAEQEAALRRHPGWSRIDYHGWVGRDRISAHFAEARAGLVVYQPTPNIMECEPNKFFEVLSAGLPLIASDLPHWRHFVAAHGCGLVVDPTSPRDIARAIEQLVDDPAGAQAMGERGRVAVQRDYSWDTDAARLVALYRAFS